MIIIDDRELLETKYSPVCTYCAHLVSIQDRTCWAYPQGIPSPIWEGENNHHAAFKGDGGIVFELHPDVKGGDPTIATPKEA